MLRFGAAAIAATAILAIQAQALAEDAKLVEPFYPAKRQFPAYDPARFVKAFDAAASLPQGIVKESSFAEKISLDGTWKISGLENSEEPFKDASDMDKGFFKADFNDSAWDSIAVPLDWYKKYPNAVKKEAPYVKGWYRKSIEIPASAAGKRTLVHFDVVGYEATLFVNGKAAGSHHGDFTPWEADITDFVSPGSKAVLALKVLSDFGPSFGVKAPAKHTYGSQWSIGNIKGGIWQHAELRIEPQIRVAEALVFPKLSESSIEVDCVIRNDSGSVKEAALRASAIPAEAALAGKGAQSFEVSALKLQPGENKLSFTLKLEKPRLWSPENPCLYNLSLPLLIDGKAVSASAFRFGYRDFKVEGGHFLLNGERCYLFGENAPSVRHGGNGESEELLKERFAKYMLDFKSIGYNIVRNPHMPIVPACVEACDEVGMMLFDEWAWSFTKNLDPVEFEKRNLTELAEWIKRDCNSASAVMWSCGNEVFYGENELTISNMNKQVALVRKLDKSGRPVSTFSGAAHDYGTRKLDTDVLDLHSYLGLGSKPWPFWESHFASIIKEISKEYANADGKIDKPFIIWECVGFSWGSFPDKSFVKDSVEDYLKYVRKPTDWGKPNGIGFAGSIGLASALNPDRGGKYGMAEIGRRILDYVRQDEFVDGFAPWFHNANLDMALIWNQPVYSGLRGEGGVPLRNVFAGSKYAQSAYVANSAVKGYEGAVFKAVLKELDGTESVLAAWEIGKLPGWTNANGEIELSIPAKGASSRWAQLRCIVSAKGGEEISRNFYDIFIASPEMAKLDAQTAIGLLSSGQTGEDAAAAILKDLGAEFKKVSKAEELSGLKTLIIPPSAEACSPLGAGGTLNSAILNWVRNGGTLLVLEQSWRGKAETLSRMISAMPAVFSDLAVSTHPAFKGLSQENFEFWNNPDKGQTASYAISPVGADLVAARGPMLAQRETFAVLADGSLGQGRIVASQFDACKLWKKDSAATIYLRNLISCVCAPAPKGLKAWEQFSDEISVAKNAKISAIDLKPYANMGFKDEVDGDGKGGWTDQGSNDFRMMPLGRQTLKSVPFEIIDPASNGGKSCIVIKGEPRGDISAAVRNVRVGEKLSRLFFLHTAAWISSSGTIVAVYTVNYADGSSIAIPVIDGASICDWWQCGSLPNAKLALSRQNAQGHEVGLTLMEWSNPHPDLEIKSIDFAANSGKEIDFAAAASSKAMGVIVAVSGEKSAGSAISLAGAKWKCLADAGNGKTLNAGPAVPVAEPAPAEGADAALLSFPARVEENAPKPAVFKSFPAAEKAKLASAQCSYLVAEIKSESDGTLEFVLPKDDWKDSLKASVSVKADGQWRSVWLRLDEDMKLGSKSWGLKDLRGEFFIFGDGKLDKRPLKLMIRDVRLQ